LPTRDKDNGQPTQKERRRCRLRSNCRILFRKEIAETVEDAAEVDSEIRFLIAALGRKD
jgi:hypothetical protein